MITTSMKKKQPSYNIKKPIFIVKCILFAWIVLGIYYARTSWVIVNDLGNYAASIPSNQNKNVYLFGSDYAVYQLLQSTPEDSKILYLVPDINNYPARAVYYLYPRSITFVATFEQALAKNPFNYDYVFVYVSLPQYMGYIKGLSNYQNQYWTPQKLVDFNNAIAPNNTLISETIAQYINQNYGIFLYELSDNNQFTRIKINE